MSLWALRATKRDHSALNGAVAAIPATEDDDGDAGDAGTVRPKHRGTAAANNAWHIAADWTEVFAPVVYDPLDQRLRDAALSERDRLDRVLADGGSLVWLLDDVPVYGRAYGEKHARRDDGFFVLVITEVDWTGVDIGELAFAARPPGKTRLRLVRAMPKHNHLAWRLLFDELGYHPDFVVADAATGIAKAVRDHFDPDRTRFVPSLWHVRRAVETCLAKLPGALVNLPEGPQLRGGLQSHLAQLTREGSALVDADAWRDWWAQLEALCAAEGLPVSAAVKARRNYEEPFADAIDSLAAHPAVPHTTGGLETLISRQVEPVLARRRTGFANIERTNNLFDLVVAREHGEFDNLADVARRLRTDATSHDGHGMPLRLISDRRPDKGRYSSLRDATLLAELANQRGIR